MRPIKKFLKEKELDLIFDLINAFALVNDSDKAALLLQDLLTRSEIKNISKRLRIAKMLLNGRKQEEIIQEMHCSFATISKISTWLDEAGLGLKDVINRLSKRQEEVHFVGNVFRQFRLPEALWEDYLNLKAFSQRKRVEDVLKNSKTKKELFHRIQKAVEDVYRNKNKLVRR